MFSRRLDSKADSACTASNVPAPAARRRAIRLFCSATIFARPIRDVEPVRGDRRPPLPQPIAATQMHSGTCEVYQLRWLGVSSDPGRRQPLPGPVRQSLRGWGAEE